MHHLDVAVDRGEVAAAVRVGLEHGSQQLRIRLGEQRPDGPPVLLLHGHPRTSATWHRVAPPLVNAGFTVVCADLRGYGRSIGPPPAPDHRPHSKRAVARDMARVMSHLGHERFAVFEHDRGSYVALRLALDHPNHEWADDIRGHGIDSGHHMAEEAPDAVVEAIIGFLADVPKSH